ncbi:class I SAM-dependent methyltransferase [Mariprofundus ferrooxydans]|uniref:class I SAM-dependent methyltransferase n=1 Tax=Mariprofundus ferrooxydans TaxID=314344 RepID=UPI000371337E|nr:class I SAM-dependent methyltransferase [Mariprofundus ferrooxydans]
MRSVDPVDEEAQRYQGMHAAQRQAMIERHRDSLDYFGYAPQALYWGTSEEQLARFGMLAGIGIRSGASLLDVGCGFGDLYCWLRSQDLVVDYTGLDISPEILAKGRELNPALRLVQGELFDFDWAPQSFDWVVLSGTLNWDVGEGSAYARRVIRRMFSLCRFGVAFNLLDIRTLDMTGLGEIVAYQPHKVLAFCEGITSDCTLYCDYLEDDFTIYMRRANV